MPNCNKCNNKDCLVPELQDMILRNIMTNDRKNEMPAIKMLNNMIATCQTKNIKE